MRHHYRYLDPEQLRALLAEQDLQRLFNQLVLAAGGDAEEAMRWMRYLQQQGHLDPKVDLERFFQQLEQRELVSADPAGRAELTVSGERLLRQSAFEDIFGNLHKGAHGYHPAHSAGEGTERLPETRPYEFGNDIHNIDATRSIHNSLKRNHGRLALAESDLEVYETDHLTCCSTVVAIDVSHSMILYGEDRITPAKTVALALTELITTRYPKDTLDVLLFGDRAEQVPLTRLPYIEAGPFHTNTRDALRLARSLLSRRKRSNQQIILITDGKPSAITNASGEVYKNPYGLDLRIVNKTLDEADHCRRQGIVITTFMIATDPYLKDFVEKLTQINRGRAYFTSPNNLGEFILADYVRNRRKRVH